VCPAQFPVEAVSGCFRSPSTCSKRR
jgi:hypothetical protein